jgi:hypothetical protein
MKLLITYLFANRLQWVFCFVFIFGLVFAERAAGGKLIIKIQAANKADVKKNVEVRSNLPSRITPDDILDRGGLNLGYDVKSDSYYVEDTLEMDPHEIKVFDVVMDDIWVIDSGQVELYRKRANALSALLSGSEYSAESKKELENIKAKTDLILTRQEKNKITAVAPIKHIQAYEFNLKDLQAVKLSVGKMENLALAAGINPGNNLIGDDIDASIPRRGMHNPDEFGEAIMKITVRNPSENRAVTTNVRSDLPAELTVDDVIDAGGLGVRYDSNKKVAYVFKYDLVLKPLESRTYEVHLNDKWNVNSGRMQFLQKKANELLRESSGRNSIEAVINTLNSAVEELDSIMKSVGPKDLNPDYIAYYRRQSDRLDAVEHELNRVDSALKPQVTERGYAPPAPDAKTTWLIIYVILGFLAAISMLFFLKWFVQSS